mmetsp:Transcript_32207/g.73653  ORF Transcript_32207/g.73653 Transcript_32207/m.73653 type:complete len:266 (-) Transcript_32207:3024-3821(-)
MGYCLRELLKQFLGGSLFPQRLKLQRRRHTGDNDSFQRLSSFHLLTPPQSNENMNIDIGAVLYSLLSNPFAAALHSGPHSSILLQLQRVVIVLNVCEEDLFQLVPVGGMRHSSEVLKDFGCQISIALQECTHRRNVSSSHCQLQRLCTESGWVSRRSPAIRIRTHPTQLQYSVLSLLLWPSSVADKQLQRTTLKASAVLVPRVLILRPLTASCCLRPVLQQHHGLLLLWRPPTLPCRSELQQEFDVCRLRSVLFCRAEVLLDKLV